MQVRHLDALRTVHLWDLDALAPVWQDASTHPLGYMFVRRMLAVCLCDFQHLDAHYHGNGIYILSYPGWLVYAIEFHAVAMATGYMYIGILCIIELSLSSYLCSVCILRGV